MVTIYDLLLTSILGICGSDASVAYPIPFTSPIFVMQVVVRFVFAILQPTQHDAWCPGTWSCPDKESPFCRRTVRYCQDSGVLPAEDGRAVVTKAEVLPPPATIVDQAGAAQVAVNTQEPTLIQFGPFPPVAVFEYRDKTYMHLTQDPVQFQSIQRKKA